MKFHRGLFRMFWRQIRIPAALGLVLFPPTVLQMSPHGQDATLYLHWIIVWHCSLVAIMLGQYRSPAMAFLYSRGYSRDELWGHQMLAALTAVLISWIPAALLVWTGLRGVYQDWAFNPVFSLTTALEETWKPFQWLALYAFWTAACQYVWICLAQPTRGRFGGILIVVGLLIVSLCLIGAHRISLEWLFDVLFVVVFSCLVAGGRILHRTLEVRA